MQKERVVSPVSTEQKTTIKKEQPKTLEVPKALLEKQKPILKQQKQVVADSPVKQTNITTQTPQQVETLQKTEQNKQETSFIFIDGEMFIDEDPPPCKIIYKMNNTKKQDIVIIAENDSCVICKKVSSDDQPKTIFGCKHWTCYKCTNPKTPVCPICNKHRYVKLPLNTDSSKEYNEIIRNKLGKQGLIKGVNEKLSIEQNIYMKFKMVKDNDLSETSYGITIDDLIKNNFTLPMLYNCLNIKTRNRLDELGFTVTHLYSRRFVSDINMLKNYGIDRNYIMGRAKTEGYPVIYMVNTDEDVEVTPLEAMLRGGYSLGDFISLGWYSNDFITDEAPRYVFFNVIKNAVCNGMRFEKVVELFKIENAHLRHYQLTNINQLLVDCKKNLFVGNTTTNTLGVTNKQSVANKQGVTNRNFYPQIQTTNPNNGITAISNSLKLQQKLNGNKTK